MNTYERCHAGHKSEVFYILYFIFYICLTSCSFNYDPSPDQDREPNLTMERVEYVRIREGNPEVRVFAEEVLRYEAIHTMEMKVFSFEQFFLTEERTTIPDVDAWGSAGLVTLETDTNNFIMKEGIEINVNSEDLHISTDELSWNHNQRILSAPGTVYINRSDGTFIKGTGFSADARRHSWEFGSAIEGMVVEDTR